MKIHMIKGILSAVAVFALLAIMSILGCFLCDTSDMFPPNAFCVMVLAISLLIPIIFCKFKRIPELLVYCASFYISFRILYTVILGFAYGIAYFLDHNGVRLPVKFAPEFWDVAFCIFIYILIGIIIGFICSIVVNVTRNIKEKKNMAEPTHNESSSTKKLDRVGFVFNIILSVIYTPVSWFSWLSLMASEATIDATNQTFIILIDIFCWITILIPGICFLGIFLSVIFRKKGYSVWSFVVQFIPLIIFGMNLLLLFFAESMPARI